MKLLEQGPGGKVQELVDKTHFELSFSFYFKILTVKIVF